MSKINHAGIVTTEANGSCVMLSSEDGALVGQLAIVGDGSPEASAKIAQHVANCINSMGRVETSKAAGDVLFERARQMHSEGWTAEHDDAHTGGELAVVAACYANPFVLGVDFGVVEPCDVPPEELPWLFPDSWDRSWWKPEEPRRNLVKAGALILAEIERLDRLEAGK